MSQDRRPIQQQQQPQRMVHPVFEDNGPARRVKVQRPQSQAPDAVLSSSSSLPARFSTSSSANRFSLSSTLPNSSRTLPHHQFHQHLHYQQHHALHHHHHHHHHHPPPPPPPPSHPVFHLPLPPLPPQLFPRHSYPLFGPNVVISPPVFHHHRIFSPQDHQHRGMPSPVQVIDLTGSSPPHGPPSRQTSRQPPRLPPRQGGPSGTRPRPREIIDVDALPDSPPVRNPSSDEVQMLYTRPGPLRQPPRVRFQGREIPRPVEPQTFRQDYMPRFNDVVQEDPILGHGGRIGQRSPDMGVNAPFYHQQPFRGTVGGPRAVNTNMMNIMVARSRHHLLRQGSFQPPQLDYSIQAAGILRPVTPPIDAAALRNVDYKTPPPPKQGFTRSPKETDVLLCAQCDQELGVESDTPKASEVWTGKCGHCYCGGCAMTFRAPPGGVSTSKRPRKAKKACVIEGCTTNLSAKTGMFKIHL